MSKDLVLKEPTELITLAIEKGADLEKLKQLLEIQREYNQDIARQAYNEAMANFKANAPKIMKDKQVSFGATKYKHATLYNVTQAISEELSRWGLSSSWRPTQTNGTISITCRIAHKMGHFEETTLTAPADKSGSKNDIQQIGSTITYLERYTLLAITGLATADQDDDGNQAAVEFIDEKQYSQLLDHINNQGLKEQAVCEYLKVEDLKKLPKADFQKALRIKKVAK